MPTLSDNLPPTFSPAKDYSSALLEFHRCQAVQAMADAQVQAAADELNEVLLENQQLLKAQVNHAFAVSVEYGMWANITLRELIDAEEALAAANQLYQLLVVAPDADSPAGREALQRAHASCVDASHAHDICLRENTLAEAELETATRYLNVITKDTPAVFQEETQPLRDACLAAANKALAAKLDTDAAKERLDALSEVLRHAADDGLAHGTCMGGSDADMTTSSTQGVVYTLEDEAAPAQDCDIALIALAPLEAAGQVLM